MERTGGGRSRGAINKDKEKEIEPIELLLLLEIFLETRSVPCVVLDHSTSFPFPTSAADQKASPIPYHPHSHGSQFLAQIRPYAIPVDAATWTQS